jgi:putative hydrolase of the HAD superfamily
MAIKNIVFDVGNVLVRWDPLAVVAKMFPGEADPHKLTQQIFKSEAWHDLNRGKISEIALIKQYHQQMGIELKHLEMLMVAIKESLKPLPGSFELLEDLYQAQFSLYALTDNTHEIMAHLRKQYNFWNRFRGVVVSADVGSLKPEPAIYRYLLDTYQLNPAETLFMDDLPANVAGAEAVGITGICFQSLPQCLQDLHAHGVSSVAHKG